MCVCIKVITVMHNKNITEVLYDLRAVTEEVEIRNNKINQHKDCHQDT